MLFLLQLIAVTKSFITLLAYTITLLFCCICGQWRFKRSIDRKRFYVLQFFVTILYRDEAQRFNFNKKQFILLIHVIQKLIVIVCPRLLSYSPFGDFN